MKKVLVVLSSVREGRVADKILEQVKNELGNYADLEVNVVDFKSTPLPLFDSSAIPSADNFSPTDENVVTWTRQVDEADAVLILTAEYNHSYTPAIKNAIDWVYKEWKDKPVALIGYGWAGGSRAINHLRDVFNSNISAKVIEPVATLHFTKEIDLDGSAIDETAVKEAINSVLKVL